MTITSYGELKAAITNWFEDRSDLAAYADEFIDLAEAFFNTELRCREMETMVDVVPATGVCTLPVDYLECRRVVERASARRPLAFITPDASEALYPTRAAGPSCHYTIIGPSLYMFPLSANNIELTYYRKVPALSDVNTSNWLLSRLPNLYLHACLMYAAEFIRDDDKIVLETQFVRTWATKLNELDARANYANAGIVLSGDTP